jgi:hypothetical protein
MKDDAFRLGVVMSTSYEGRCFFFFWFYPPPPTHTPGKKRSQGKIKKRPTESLQASGADDEGSIETNLHLFLDLFRAKVHNFLLYLCNTNCVCPLDPPPTFSLSLSLSLTHTDARTHAHAHKPANMPVCVRER